MRFRCQIRIHPPEPRTMTSTSPPLDAVGQEHAVRRARGAALRAARRAAGLSARALAEQVNARTRGSDVTTDAVYSYENGRVLLSQELAERFATTLEIPVEQLVKHVPGHPSTDVAPAPAPAPGRAGADPDADAARAEGIRVGQLMLARHVLLARADVALRQLRMYREQLGMFHTHVLDRAALDGLERTLRLSLRAQTDAPEAAWIRTQPPDALHEPLQELLSRFDASLAVLPEPGAAPPTEAAVAQALGALADDAGRVEKLMPADVR